MVVKPKNIDEYLAALSDDKRAALSPGAGELVTGDKTVICDSRSFNLFLIGFIRDPVRNPSELL